MNKKKYIHRIIIIAIIILVVGGVLIWHLFEKKKSPVYLFQSLTNENLEIEMCGYGPMGYSLTLEEKTECIELLKNLTTKDVYIARRDTLGTTPEYGYLLKTQGKEYIIHEEYTIFGQGTLYYKGEYWYIKSKELKKLMKEHYEKYKNISKQ